jgi:hypothetical protein
VTETYDLKKGFGVAMLLWLLLRLTKKEVTKEYKGSDIKDHQLKYLTSIEAFAITLKLSQMPSICSHNPQRKAHNRL